MRLRSLLGSLSEKLKSHRADVLLAASLLVLFAALYLAIGLPMLGPMVTHHMSVDGADSEAIIAMLTRYEESYYNTGRHPLFVILLNPLGQLLGMVTGSKELAALLLNVICGAALPALFFAILRAVGLNKFDAALFCVLLGISAGYLIFSSIPETYIFSAFSVLALIGIHVFSGADRTFLAWFVPASIISFGMSVANLAAITIVLFFRYRNLGLPKRILMLAVANLGVVAVAAALALLQGTIYRNPRFFFGSEPYTDPGEFFTLDLFTKPLGHLKSYLPDLLVNGVIAVRGVASDVVFFEDYFTGDHLILLFFGERGEAFRSEAVLAWVLLAAFSLVFILRHQLHRQVVFLIFGAYLLTNVLLYLVYDPQEIFVFSPTFTFALIALVAMPFRSLRGNSALVGRSLLVLALILVAINNTLFIERVLAELRSALSVLPPRLDAS
jgi:hypothetical protein